MEYENTVSKYVYIVLKGEVKLMKRPENLYDKEGKMIKLNQELRCLKDPR